jgi:hypothetical protein
VGGTEGERQRVKRDSEKGEEGSAEGEER